MLREVCAAVAMSLLVAGCSSGAPDCSATNIQETVKSLGKKETANRFRSSILQNYFDAMTSRYDLNGIRTVAGNSRKCSCKATLHITLEFNEKMKEMKDKDPKAWKKLNNETPIAILGEDININIDYNVERTDDGREYYVTLTRTEGW